MNNKFDELAKGLAQSVTRRQALKRFGVGLAGMALACFGLANRAEANGGGHCLVNPTSLGTGYLNGYCGDCKGATFSTDCPFGTGASITKVCKGFFASYGISSIECHR